MIKVLIYLQVYRSQVILRSLSVFEIVGGSRNGQAKRLTRIFILHSNIYATCLKNAIPDLSNLGEITLRIISWELNPLFFFLFGKT